VNEALRRPTSRPAHPGAGARARGASGGGPAARSGSSSAFTLIELLVTMAIIGLLAGVGLYSLGGFQHGRLQDQAFKISRMSRNALIRALSRAVNVRMVLDLDSFDVWIEEASNRPLVDEQGQMVVPDGGEDAEDAFLGTGGYGAGEGPELPGTGMEGELTGTELTGEGDGGGGLFGSLGLGDLLGGGSGLEELRKPPRYVPPVFEPIDEPRLKRFHLEAVKSMRVYYPGAEEPISEGQTYVFYRDDGTADEAVIHVEDEQGGVYAIAINGLTGRGAVYPYPYIPEEAEESP
jgi:prepilin-type N-terminal cleavage/methylation domain-containing protein